MNQTEHRRQYKGPGGVDGEDFDQIVAAIWTLVCHFGKKYFRRRYDPLKFCYENRPPQCRVVGTDGAGIRPAD